jgi:hypothetical protein
MMRLQNRHNEEKSLVPTPASTGAKLSVGMAR